MVVLLIAIGGRSGCSYVFFSRMIHIEVVEEMSACSFLNAVRRFVSMHGKVQEFRSDKSSNFVSSTDTTRGGAVNVQDKLVCSFLLGHGITWIFNHPHSSHFGGGGLGENNWDISTCS